MKWLKLWMLVCATGLAVGCGGESAEMASESEEMGVSSQELTVCTATCDQGTVSCPATTTTCSATHYVGVTCDGVTLACPPPPPPPTCDSCASLRNQVCDSPGVQVDCCWDDGTESMCFCHPSRRRFICDV